MRGDISVHAPRLLSAAHSPVTRREHGRLPPYERSCRSLVAHHALLLGVHPVELVDVLASDDLGPALLVHVVDAHHAAGGAIAMRGVVDGAATELDGVFHGHVAIIGAVQDAIGEGRTGADGEALALETLAAVIHHVQRGALLVPSGDHRAAREALAFVLEENVGQELGCGGHGDALLGSELVHAAEAGQVALPKGAVGGTASHGSEQEAVDLDDLLHRLGADVRTHRGTGVHCNDDAMLEDEAQGCGAVLEVHEAGGAAKLLHVLAEGVGAGNGRQGEALDVDAARHLEVTASIVILRVLALGEDARVREEGKIHRSARHGFCV
mmetsp:Transcript_76737/g.206918  ORF Transcript_76737/g.206918 Transcript_76737/m.206918 type:complete len:325 (+) Transcript_76737:199-1173(+)